jgi:hypothetical protein
MRCGIRPSMLFALALKIVLLPSLGFAQSIVEIPPFDPSAPTIVVTDVMPDDMYLEQRFASLLKNRTMGRNLLVVTTDGDTTVKARASHGIFHFFGSPFAQIVAGSPNTIEATDPLRVEYVHDYDAPALANMYAALSQSHEPSSWVADEYRSAIIRFVEQNQGIQLLVIANPASFVDVQDSVDPKKFRGVYRNGLFKNGILAYNGNRNVAATAKHIEWTAQHRIPTLDLPSDLLAGFSPHEAEPAQKRSEIFQRGSTEHPFLSALEKGFGTYTGAVRDALIRKYSAQAPFIMTFDPRSRGWYQDSIFLEALLDPKLVQSEFAIASIDTSPSGKQALGFTVQQVGSNGVPSAIVRSVDFEALAEQMAGGMERIQITPSFKPAEAVANRSHSPLVLINKASIDDEGALVAALGLGSLGLVIAESSRTEEIALRYRRTLDAYRATSVPSVAGKGHSLQAMQDPSTNLGLEYKIATAGHLSAGFLTDMERAAFNLKDPSSLSAAAELTQFLERNPKSIVVNNATVATLLAVLKSRPDLASHIPELHLMGGFRKPANMPEAEFKVGGRGYQGGVVTRNWKDLATVKELFELLEELKVPTWVYSSHHSGGSADTFSLPKYAALLEELESIAPVAVLQKQARLNWNSHMAPGSVDPDTALGPPLGYLTIARAALGSDAADMVFGATRGHFVFGEKETVDFVPDEVSSITMLNVFDKFEALDETLAVLTGRLVDRMKTPDTTSASCSDQLNSEKPKRRK